MTKSGFGLMTWLCPHWYDEVPEVWHPEGMMFDVENVEKCRICGKRRMYVKVPEPHPGHDREELLDDLQQPRCEFIVEEWLPYNAKGP